MDPRPSDKQPSGGDIVGICLTVDASGSQPAQSLKFWKSRARVIEIGRRSAQAKGDECDARHAMFRCPVISRKHAKITFSEYGNVYVTDLKSHHGTYILRPGDSVSRSIVPEVPSVLADGDILTFGKAVGKDKDVVRPVSARISLQFSRAEEPIPVAATASRETNSPKNASGRYGVYTPGSDSSSSSESDSDIEEISSPLFAPPPTLHTHGFEFNHLLRQTSAVLCRDTPDLLRRHILQPTPFFSPSPEPPMYPLGSQFDFDSESIRTNASPEVMEVEAPLLSDSLSSPSESSNSNHLQSDLPPLIGAWPKSPEHSIIPSSPRTPAEESNNTHVSPASRSSQVTEELLPDDRVEEVYHNQTLYVAPPEANVWATNMSPQHDAEEEAAEPEPPSVEQETASSRMHIECVSKGLGVGGEAPAVVSQAFSAAVVDEGQVAEVAESDTVVSVPTASIVTPNCTMTEVASDDAVLKSFNEAMKKLRADAQQEVERELAALRAARAEAEAGAFQIRAAQEKFAKFDAANAAPATTSTLKRKRFEVELEELEDGKRRKTSTTGRVVSVVAQTTAIATLGAVAAWTALAYT